MELTKVGVLQSCEIEPDREYPEMVQTGIEEPIELSKKPVSGGFAFTTASVIRDPDSGSADGNQEHVLATFGRYCLEMGYPDFTEPVKFPSDSLVRQSIETRISRVRHWDVADGDIIAEGGIKYPGPPPKFIAGNDIVALIPLLYCGEWEWYGWNRTSTL